MKKHIGIFIALTLSAALKADDPSDIIQVVLDFPEIEIFLHPEMKERIPVLVSGDSIPHDFTVKKFGQNVLKVTPAKIETRPIIIFDKISVHSLRAEVDLRYPAEGVNAFFTLKRGSEKWEIERFKVVEK
jgi:hypothetical protein